MGSRLNGLWLVLVLVAVALCFRPTHAPRKPESSPTPTGAVTREPVEVGLHYQARSEQELYSFRVVRDRDDWHFRAILTVGKVTIEDGGLYSEPEFRQVCAVFRKLESEPRSTPKFWGVFPAPPRGIVPMIEFDGRESSDREPVRTGWCMQAESKAVKSLLARTKILEEQRWLRRELQVRGMAP